MNCPVCETRNTTAGAGLDLNTHERFTGDAARLLADRGDHFDHGGLGWDAEWCSEADVPLIHVWGNTPQGATVHEADLIFGPAGSKVRLIAGDWTQISAALLAAPA